MRTAEEKASCWRCVLVTSRKKEESQSQGGHHSKTSALIRPKIAREKWTVRQESFHTLPGLSTCCRVVSQRASGEKPHSLLTHYCCCCHSCFVSWSVHSSVSLVTRRQRCYILDSIRDRFPVGVLLSVRLSCDLSDALAIQQLKAMKKWRKSSHGGDGSV
jgi:hypothetical protein